MASAIQLYNILDKNSWSRSVQDVLYDPALPVVVVFSRQAGEGAVDPRPKYRHRGSAADRQALHNHKHLHKIITFYFTLVDNSYRRSDILKV